MKTKNLNSLNTTILVYFIFSFILHSFTYVYTIKGTPYFEKSLVLITFGISLLLYVSASFSSIIELPSNVYKTDGIKYIFYNNNFDIYLKCFLFILSGIMIFYGSYLEPENLIIESRRSSWISTALSFFLLFAITLGAVQGLLSLIRSKKDKIIIDPNDIYWIDDQTGENKIEMKLISKVEISEKEICIKILESNTKINLEEMSLIVFKSKIQEVLTNCIGKEKIIVLDK